MASTSSASSSRGFGCSGVPAKFWAMSLFQRLFPLAPQMDLALVTLPEGNPTHTSFVFKIVQRKTPGEQLMSKLELRFPGSWYKICSSNSTTRSLTRCPWSLS